MNYFNFKKERLAAHNNKSYLQIHKESVEKREIKPKIPIHMWSSKFFIFLFLREYSLIPLKKVM